MELDDIRQLNCEGYINETYNLLWAQKEIIYED